jgi:HAD superfamily hydrolase (TIGR01509 family)
MVKAIIFDFFDVFRTDAYKAWLTNNNIPHEGGYLEASRLQDLGEITTDQFIERLSDLRGYTVTIEEIDATARVDTEMVELARKLHEHYPTALLSNAPSPFIRKLLTDHDLSGLFDEIIISSEVGVSKPSKEIFAIALERLVVTPKDALFIDDNSSHTTAAEKLGIPSIQFTSVDQLAAALSEHGVVVG